MEDDLACKRAEISVITFDSTARVGGRLEPGTHWCRHLSAPVRRLP
jgi:hypothetical protein